MRLVAEQLLLDGLPMRNLATFVTTWMQPEAQRIKGGLHELDRQRVKTGVGY
jgi:hypothetical protein